MAFPSNPSNGDTYLRYGRTYEYDSAMSMWKVKKSSIVIDDLDDVDLTTVAPQTGDYLQYDGTNFVPFNTAKLVSYATVSQLPLVNVTNGQMAYVQDLGRLYIWNGNGWFSVALVNTAPTITTGPDASYVFAKDGTPIVLTLEAEDPEGIPITWSYQVTSGVLGNTAVIVQNDNVFTITPSTNEADVGEFSITFTASDGVNLATASTSFTLAFGSADAYYNYNTLLIKADSTIAANNSAFIDSSSNQVTVSTTGNVYQGSLSPYSLAGWSGDFDGANDYLMISDSTELQFGTGDFTIEAWVYVTSWTSTTLQTIICKRDDAISYWRLGTTGSAGDLSFRTELMASPGLLAAGALSLNEWTHVAVTRYNATYYLFVNGQQVATTTSGGTDSVDYSGIPIRIGSAQTSNVYKWPGYISDLRIVKGTAVYTENFTSPAKKLTAISGTSLLTLQDAAFVDRSSNNFAISVYGNTSLTPNSPYLPPEDYDRTIHGGSLMSDGVTGSYLTVPVSFDRRNSSWTFEAWYYPKIPSNQALVGSGSTFYIQWNGSTFYVGDGATNIINTSLPLIGSRWYHIAVSYDGTTTRAFINGKLLTSTTIKLAAGAITSVFVGRRDANYYMRSNDMISDFRFVADAVYTSDFPLPSEPIPEVANTQVLLRMGNAGIYDAMSKNIMMPIGNTIDTNVTKYNTSSMYFDGTDRMDIPVSDNLYFSTLDFTVEGWFYTTTSANQRMILTNRPSVSQAPAGSWWFDNFNSTPGQIRVVFSNQSSVGRTVQTSTQWPVNEWFHFAVVRTSTKIEAFLNGISIGSITVQATDAFGNGTEPIRLGSFPDSTAWAWTGYMEDVRITKGYARYIANFTPPTAALGFSNAE